jgi:hypothetical protein
MSQEKLNLLEFTSCLMAESRACPAQVMWSKAHQTAVGRSLFHDGPDHLRRKPFPHTLPALLMARKSGPELIPATIAHSSIAVFTQFGIGTVRM